MVLTVASYVLKITDASPWNVLEVEFDYILFNCC